MKEFPIGYQTIYSVIVPQADSTIPLKLVDSTMDWVALPLYVYRQILAHYPEGQLPEGKWLPIFNAVGELECVWMTIDPARGHFMLGDCAHQLPVATYRLESTEKWFTPTLCYQLSLGFALGAYRFQYFAATHKPLARLVMSDLEAIDELVREVQAVYVVRDLVNMPANVLTPAILAKFAQRVAEKFKANYREIIGDELLEHNFPLIYHVGKASAVSPRLIEINYGDNNHPKLTLIGKGVCFDSGGLDLKPASGMRLMKKDMAGAAQALALAEWIMAARWPIQLQVLLPCVENSVAGTAFRPGDILTARNGLFVEIDNTDAEGRLILADALSYAEESNADLMIDFATLTGAARVALGTEVGVLFGQKVDWMNALIETSFNIEDPLWQLPLYKPYAAQLDSKTANIANASSQPYAGAITAALFLQRFVSPETAWLHIDFMGWNLRQRTGRPEGGEAMGLRSIFHALKRHFVPRRLD